MFIKALSKLLWAANSDVNRAYWFYPIKEHILKQYGQRVAWDQQHIVKKCWSCKEGVFSGYYNWYRWVDMSERICFKCNGNGVFDEVWVLLEVWHFGKYEFHRPAEFHRPTDRVRSGEYFRYPTGLFDPIRKKIEGYIRHKPHHRAKEAFWTLAVIFTPRRVIEYILERIIGKFRSRWWKMKPRLRFWRRNQDCDIPF